MAQPVAKEVAEHGTRIFFYNNIRTNQVIYSLSRTLNNVASLAQLPFLGKKTVPARLRKDLWHPFCLVEFPRPSQGLLAFRRLREFRRLHETSYPLSLITRAKGQLLPKKQRGKVLMDQKANSIADLAAVLQLQKEGWTQEHVQTRERQIERVRMQKERGKQKYRRRDPQGPPEMGVEGVRVRWTNLLDAEFAETWPEKVVHDGLTRHRYTAALPLVEGDVEQKGGKDVPAPLLDAGGKPGLEARL
ncbi:MAG: hypothetical protein L6R35_000730 [Caloplaca aegaea]|nr:MAG: hypothetical protein LQ341_002722 [Variospora aurantia]KAI4289991.1 MAG: hypothetical protein L6R35_000730 [Caloplaca aegaea]